MRNLNSFVKHESQVRPQRAQEGFCSGDLGLSIWFICLKTKGTACLFPARYFIINFQPQAVLSPVFFLVVSRKVLRMALDVTRKLTCLFKSSSLLLFC